MTTAVSYLKVLCAELREMCLDRWVPSRETLMGCINEALRANSLEPLRAADPEARWDVIVAELEELPIVDEEVRPFGWLFFVRSGDRWWPAHGGDVHLHPIYGATLNYCICYTDGSRESGVAFPGDWAHCTADNTPSIPFKYDCHS